MVEEWLTLEQVCEILHIGKMTLWRLRRSGKLKDSYPRGRPAPGVRGMVMVRIARSELERFMLDGMKETVE